jgi:TetR/AcrR family transcriptional repressor of nem operon
MATKSTRDHLIDVGVGLMHQNGYNATGLTDILKAADVPKGSFYHHFGSKEDFAAAALERYGMRERVHAAAVLNDMTTPPLKRLRRYFSDLVKMYGQKGAIPGCMMGRFSLEIAGESPQLRKRISASFDHWQHTIATVIGQAITQKELPAGTDSRVAWRALCSTAGRGRCCVRRLKKATRRSKASCATSSMSCCEAIEGQGWRQAA